MQPNHDKKMLLLATLFYSVVFAYCLVNLLHIAHIASNKPLLPFMPISLGVKAILFNCIFIGLHFFLGLLAAMPIWLPLLFGGKRGKVAAIVNWLCVFSLLTIVPLNSYVVSNFATVGQFNIQFSIIFSLMLGATIFASVVVYQRELRRRFWKSRHKVGSRRVESSLRMYLIRLQIAKHQSPFPHLQRLVSSGWRKAVRWCCHPNLLSVLFSPYSRSVWIHCAKACQI